MWAKYFLCVLVLPYWLLKLQHKKPYPSKLCSFYTIKTLKHLNWEGLYCHGRTPDHSLKGQSPVFETEVPNYFRSPFMRLCLRSWRTAKITILDRIDEWFDSALGSFMFSCSSVHKWAKLVKTPYNLIYEDERGSSSPLPLFLSSNPALPEHCGRCNIYLSLKNSSLSDETEQYKQQLARKFSWEFWKLSWEYENLTYRRGQSRVMPFCVYSRQVALEKSIPI